MKPIHVFAATALLALASTVFASATTTTILHVGGATSFRAALITAEANILNAQASGGVTAVYFDTGSSASLTHANQSVLYGPVTGSGNQTIIENDLAGSIGALISLTETANSGDAIAKFPAASSYTGTATAITTFGSGGTVAVGGAFVDTASNTVTVESPLHPDVALVDNSLNSAALIYTRSNTPSNLIVGIGTYEWVASKGAPSDLTNVNAGQLNTILSAGVYPLAFFTGNHAEETSYVYLIGRDIDAGTRAAAFAETGFGVASLPVQYYPYDSATDATNNTLTGVIGLTGSGSAINALNFVPAETVDGIAEPYNTGGYSTGTPVVAALKATNNISNVYLLTALGYNDAVSAVAGGAKVLNYNGVAFSASAVNEGTYTFWGQEHLYYLPALDTGRKALITSLKNQFLAGDQLASSGGVTVASLQVSRSDDGQSVSITYSPTYPY